MVIPVTEKDGLTYRQDKAFVVKDYSIHDVCTIEHLYGMEIEEPNSEGCLDLACHYCNTSRNSGDNPVIKPYVETKHSPFKGIFGHLNAIREESSSQGSQQEA